MNERFFPSAIARRWRVPEGRASRTRLSADLYAARASLRSRSGFASLMGAPRRDRSTRSRLSPPRRAPAASTGGREARQRRGGGGVGGWAGRRRAARRRRDAWGEGVGADREELGVEEVRGDRGRRHFHHDPQARPARGSARDARRRGGSV